jgi:response regulator of citrate/malate metabolism
MKIHYVLHPAKLKQLKEAVKDQNMSRREQKQKEYKQAKYKKMTILNQKTSKGQPLMNGRMKLLYEKIQKNYDRENKQ